MQLKAAVKGSLHILELPLEQRDAGREHDEAQQAAQRVHVQCSAGAGAGRAERACLQS